MNQEDQQPLLNKPDVTSSDNTAELQNKNLSEQAKINSSLEKVLGTALMSAIVISLSILTGGAVIPVFAGMAVAVFTGVLTLRAMAAGKGNRIKSIKDDLKNTKNQIINFPKNIINSPKKAIALFKKYREVKKRSKDLEIEFFR